MSVAVKGVSTGNACPVHAAGDLLVAFQWYDSNEQVNAGWTKIASYPTYWSTEACTLAYRVATTSSTSAPFPATASHNRVYAITGANPTNPIAGEYHNSFTSGPYTIPTVDLSTTSKGTGGSARIRYANSSMYVGTNANHMMGTGDFTIECWWYPRTFSGNNGYHCIFQKGYTSYGDGGITLQCTDNASGYLALTTNGTQIVASSIPATLKAWNHVAVVRKSGVTKIYINGVVGGSASDTTNYNSNYDFYIGTSYTGNYAVDGNISNFRVVKGTAVYDGNFTPPSGQLTAITNTTLLTCQSSTTITDASPFNYTINRSNVYPSPLNRTMSLTPGTVKLTLLAGTGGGGNPGMVPNDFEGQGFNFVNGTWGISNLDGNGYHYFVEGGVGNLVNNSGNVWVQRVLSVTVNPAPASGFFAMF